MQFSNEYKQKSEETWSIRRIPETEGGFLVPIIPSKVRRLAAQQHR